jgi:hypothetical protein
MSREGRGLVLRAAAEPFEAGDEQAVEDCELTV